MQTLTQHSKRYGTEEACLDYLVSLRWPNGEVFCPRCGSAKVYKVKKAYRWVCKACAKNGYRFSPLAGTIFENTKYPLVTWFQVIYLMCQSKKGISAMQIHRQIGSGDYRTAWYMCHRIRAAMKNTEFSKLMGEVEVDETYVGGRYENRHRTERKRRAGRRTKVPVVAAISRKGSVVARVIEHADVPTLDGFVREVVSENVSLIASDEHHGYGRLAAAGYPHQTVKHRAGEYARGVVHTANIDSFWSLFKRGIVGNFHVVSKKYMPFYLAEFTFRHNYRQSPDLFEQVLLSC
jgi:transposase-like protein